MGGRGDDTICIPFFLRKTFAFTQGSFTVTTAPSITPSPNNNFGRRLDFSWTLFSINVCSYWRLRDTDERVFCLVNTIKIRPLFLLAYREGLRASQSKAKYVTSEVRARIVCDSHSKSTIPAWDATCLSQERNDGLYCRNMHPQLLVYLTLG